MASGSTYGVKTARINSNVTCINITARIHNPHQVSSKTIYNKIRAVLKRKCLRAVYN